MKTRGMVKKALSEHRVQLGDRKFEALVDEIMTMRTIYQAKIDALPKIPIGMLDGNVAELRLLERDEAMKWVLIKQKYGI